MMKIEPKRICWVAPVVALVRRVEVEEQCGQPDRGAEHDAGRQVAAPHPLHADRLHRPGAEDAAADEARERADPDEERPRTPGRRHVGQRVAGEGLAAHHREHADDRRDDRDDRAEQRPPRGPVRWRRSPARRWTSARRQPTSSVGSSADRSSRCRGRRRPGPGRGLEHVDVVAVERAQHVGADDLLGRAARRAAAGEVDDAVHHRQERVHLVRREQDRDVVLLRDPVRGARRSPARCSESRFASGSSSNSSLGRLIERVGDEHPLLLAARERPDAGVGERVGVDRVPASPRRARAARRSGGAAHRSGARRGRAPTRSRARIGMSGSSEDLLGDVADGAAAPARARRRRPATVPESGAAARG